MTQRSRAVSLSFLLHTGLLFGLLILGQQKDRIKPAFSVQFDLSLATAITENPAESALSKHIPVAAQTVNTVINRPAEPVRLRKSLPDNVPEQPQKANQQTEKKGKQSFLSIEKKREDSNVQAKTRSPAGSQRKLSRSSPTPATLPAPENVRSTAFGINPMSRQKTVQTGNQQKAEQHARQSENEGKRFLDNNFDYIRKLVLQNLTFPTAARKMGWTGKILVQFTIRNDGEVADIAILSSSGHDQLDDNVISAIQRTSPFPKPPVQAQLILPISYSLK